MHVEVAATRWKGGGGSRTTDLHLAKLGNRGRENDVGVEVKMGLEASQGQKAKVRQVQGGARPGKTGQSRGDRQVKLEAADDGGKSGI